MAQILVVEDHDDTREMMAELLRIEGYDVVEAENGQIALDLLTARDGRAPNLVLLDMAMPVMSGPELLNQLDTRGLLPELPIVVVSATSTALDAQRARAFLPKPPPLDKLLETVRRFCAPDA
jgi:CheY-like chemotaxis protein